MDGQLTRHNSFNDERQMSTFSIPNQSGREKVFRVIYIVYVGSYLCVVYVGGSTSNGPRFYYAAQQN